MKPIHARHLDPILHREPFLSTSSGERRRAALLALGAALLGGATGCLCPPCAAGPASASNAPAPATAAPSSNAAAAPAASGKPTVIWDGEDVTTGKSWASCDKAGACKATLVVAPGEGANGSSGLKLHAEGSGWQGGGWNWFGWYPEDAGTDLSGYDELRFSIKVTGKTKETTPNAGGISLAFGCSKEKKTSAAASLGKYAANASDGQWHEVSIPLVDFFGGKGAECDSRTAWEFRVSSWSGTPLDFDVVLDNVAVAKK